MYRTYASALLAIMVGVSSGTMQGSSVAAQLENNERIKAEIQKGVTIALTSLGLGLALAEKEGDVTAWIAGAKDIEDPAFKAFVYEQCRQAGVENPEKLFVKVSSHQSIEEGVAVATSQGIIVSQTILDEYKKGTVDADMIAFVLRHEATHILKKDTKTRGLASWLSAVGCLYGLGKIYDVYAKNPHWRTKNMVQNLGFIVAVFGPLLMLCRSQEKRCDLHAAKTPELAEGGARFFKNLRQKYMQFPFSAAVLNFAEKHPRIARVLFANTHPQIHDRITYLEEKAQELKKEQEMQPSTVVTA